MTVQDAHDWAAALWHQVFLTSRNQWVQQIAAILRRGDDDLRRAKVDRVRLTKDNERLRKRAGIT